MKAGFHNIPVREDTRSLLGVITQDGLYRYNRMAFGLLEAPMFFQYVMELLTTPPREHIQNEPYLDDLTQHGTEW